MQYDQTQLAVLLPALPVQQKAGGQKIRGERERGAQTASCQAANLWDQESSYFSTQAPPSGSCLFEGARIKPDETKRNLVLPKGKILLKPTSRGNVTVPADRAHLAQANEQHTTIC